MSNSSSIQYINSNNLENISSEDARTSSQLSGEAINREHGNNEIQKQAKSSNVQNVNLHNGYLVGNNNPNADFGITNCNVGEPNNVHGNVPTHNIGPAYIFISNNGQMHSAQNNAAHVNSGFVQCSSENLAMYNNVVNSSLELSMQDVSSNTNNIVSPQNVIIVNSTPVSFIPIQSQVQSGAQVSLQTDVVVHQPNKMRICKELPVDIICPNCDKQITTELFYKAGVFSVSLFAGICLCLGWCGCCLIPFLHNGCKDIHHVCPKCHQTVGVFV